MSMASAEGRGRRRAPAILFGANARASWEEGLSTAQSRLVSAELGIWWISFLLRKVGWVERSEPHHGNLPEKWWGSLRSTHPTIAGNSFRNGS